MENLNQIEISLSKTKMLLNILGALIFVFLGVWLLIYPPEISHWIFGNPIVIFSTSISLIIFFGLISVLLLRKFLFKKPGLIINSQGIIDKSSGNCAGLIPWRNIEAIKVSQVMNKKFLLIFVNNPQDYINNISSPIKRRFVRLNYKSMGTPISISSNELQIDFEGLHKILLDKMKEFN